MRNWDWVEGIRAHSPAEIAVSEVAKLVAKEIANWPPKVEWAAEARAQAQECDSFLGVGCGPPSQKICAEALKLARWQLARDYEALDYYERNHHLALAFSLRRDRATIEFLRRYFEEAFFEILERTENRIKRREILQGWSEVELRVASAAGCAEPTIAKE